MGTETSDHRGFLDRAHELKLNVLPGIDSNMACPENDCYNSWKAAVRAGLKNGFSKDGGWHPAVDTVILLNQPDYTPCGTAKVNYCRVKKALSAMEGFIAAEKEMNITPGRVKLTITWSFGVATSVDGNVTGPGVYGFQDMVAGTADPSLAHYTPRTSAAEIKKAFDARWIHSLNTQSPWSYVNDVISAKYQAYLPKQWFIGEYGANGQTSEAIQQDLHSMDSFATGDEGFRGACFYQFQADYLVGGTQRYYGLFSLGKTKIGDTSKVCQGNTCDTFPVYCLETALSWFEPSQQDLDHRAEAAAKGWGGSANNKGRCKTLPVALAV
jgi:hypothetical protein